MTSGHTPFGNEDYVKGAEQPRNEPWNVIVLSLFYSCLIAKKAAYCFVNYLLN